MKQTIIAGNWKSNMTIIESRDWIQQWNAKCQMPNAKWKNIRVILFVPFTLLYFLKNEIAKQSLPILLGAQDVSPFSEGAHTGEESARQIKELADWVLIGHSERRSQFQETDEELAYETLQAKTAGLSVLYCVSDNQMRIPGQTDALAYEPLTSIGSGKPEDPVAVELMIKNLKKHHHIHIGLYGGSVTAGTAGSYINQPSIDGVLVGGASLDPLEFARIIEQVV